MPVTILIADKFPEESLEKLKKLNCLVEYDPGLSDESLLIALSRVKPEVIVVRSTKMAKEMIEHDPSLSLIIRAGAGFNTIDVETASRRSVYVANCPGKNSAAVAELAIGLCLSIDRRIPDNVSDFRNGTWNKAEYSKAEGILGKTMGIIGTGRIGQETAGRARGLGIKVIAWSRSLTPEKAESLGVGYCEKPLEVAEKADIISVHLAAAHETTGFINEKFFNAMKEGAIFINTSRSEVVDEKALLKAVESKGIRAGLDVFAGEPSGKTGDVSSDLQSHPNIYVTHHIGASTNQAQMAVADEVINIVQTYLSSGEVRNCVNLLDRTPATYVLSVRHRNRVGVLASVLHVLSEAKINVESMENIIFQGIEGACANIQIDSALSPGGIKQIEELGEDIHSVSMREISAG